MSAGRLPTFLVVGAMKAGTTSLWNALRSHPQVFMPALKEFHFFSDPQRAETGLDWYREQFARAGDAVAIGEASTNYTKHPRRPGTPARISAVIPDVRLIYLVREPISRIRSHYLHVVHAYGERRPLSAVVREDPEYLDISRYRMQLDQYLRCFDRAQLLVVRSDSLRRDREATLAQVFEFVGVDPSAQVAAPARDAHLSSEKRLDTAVSSGARRLPGYELARRIAPQPVKRLARRMTRRRVADEVDASLPKGLREELLDELRPDIVGLRPFLGPTFDAWGIG